MTSAYRMKTNAASIEANLQDYEQSPWIDCGIDISTLIAWHKLEWGVWTFNPTDPLFLKILQLGDPKQTDKTSGRVVQWKVERVFFHLMIGVNGTITYYPRGRPGREMSDALHDFLTREAGYTEAETKDFVNKVQLKRLEAASAILKNDKQILEKGVIARIYFPGLTHIPAAKVRVWADGSFEILELETGGTASETATVHKLIVHPAEAAAYMRQTRDAQIELALLLQNVGTELARLQVTQGTTEQAIRKEVQQIWRALASMERGLLSFVTQKHPTLDVDAITKAVREVVKTELKPLHDEIRSGRISQEDLTRELIDAVHENTDTNRMGFADVTGEIRHQTEETVNQEQMTQDRLDTMEQDIRQNDANAELRHTESMNQVDHEALNLKILGTGAIEGIRVLNAKVEAYHQGVIHQAQFFLKKMKILEQNDERLEKNDAELRAEFDRLRVELVRRHVEEQHRKMEDRTTDKYAWIYWLSQYLPAMTAKDIARLLDVPGNFANFYLKQMIAWGYLDREKRLPPSSPAADPEPHADLKSDTGIHDPVRGSAGPEDCHPDGINEPVKRKHILRRVWHYFRRNRSPELNTPSNEQKIKPEDEKT